MKKLLNTIYVTTEGEALRKDGENIVAEIDGVERSRAPLHRLSSVVVVGAIHVSPPLPPTRRERFRACWLIELCRPDIVAWPVRAWRSRMVERSLNHKGCP